MAPFVFRRIRDDGLPEFLGQDDRGHWAVKHSRAQARVLLNPATAELLRPGLPAPVASWQVFEVEEAHHVDL